MGVGYGRTSGGQSFTNFSTHTASAAGGTRLAQDLAPPRRPRTYQSRPEAVMVYGAAVAAIVWGAAFFVYGVRAGTDAENLAFVIAASLPDARPPHGGPGGGRLGAATAPTVADPSGTLATGYGALGGPVLLFPV